MKIEKSLVSGSMAMLILSLLEEKDRYGYEMIEALREKSQNVFELKAGTLYPLLHGLEEKNFVSCYEQEVVGKVRKYYSLTATGRKKAGREKRRVESIRKSGDGCADHGGVDMKKERIFTHCDGSDPL